MKENQHTEWKESWRDDYLRWVCGFANAEGGTLVIGRNDQGQAVGVANAARLTFAFAPAKPLVRGEKWGEKAAATRLALVQAMRRNPQISTVALAAVVGMASTSGVEKHLKALREAGCIRRVGPAKGGTWEVMEDVL